MEKLKLAGSWFLGLFVDLLGSRKVRIFVIGLVLTSLRRQFPDWPLPSAEEIEIACGALLGAHTVTDIVAIVAQAVRDYIAHRERALAGAK